jgi:hypothetical protein
LDKASLHDFLILKSQENKKDQQNTLNSNIQLADANFKSADTKMSRFSSSVEKITQPNIQNIPYNKRTFLAY